MRRFLRLLSLGLFVLLCLALFPPVQAASFWSQTYGEEGAQQAFAIIATSDGGYAVAGTTNSLGAGGYDFWLLKTDADGNVQWNKTYGSERDEAAFSLTATPDGGYVLAGVSSNSSGYLVWLKHPLNEPFSGTDVWVVKTDNLGNQQWNKTYRGGGDSNSYNMAYSVVATSDDGYAFCGATGNSTDPPYGGFWLVKIDAQGSMLWNSTFSSGPELPWEGEEEAYALVQTADGGYAVAGNMATNTGLFFWVIKTGSSGIMQWNKTYGNSAIAFALTKTTDGGYAVAGVEDGSYGHDCLLVKTDGEGNVQWSHKYNAGVTGYHNDYPHAVIQTSDGGYVLTGEWDCLTKTAFHLGPWTVTRTEAYLVKTDASGNMQWNRTYGDDNSFEGAYGVVEAQDGGYVLAGVTSSDTSSNAWLLKTDDLGVVPERFSLLTLSLVIAVTLPLLFCKKRLLRRHT